MLAYIVVGKKKDPKALYKPQKKKKTHTHRGVGERGSEESVVPTEEHDDAAADDVKPRFLLAEDPADPPALRRRHFSAAPHLLHRLS